MCQTQAEGGRRCAAHTRPRYDALIAAMDAARSPMGKADARNKVRRTFTADDENALNVAINHASTPTGYKQVERDLERFRAEGDTKTVMFLGNALRRGEERAEAAKEVTATIRKAKEQAKRKLTGSTGELVRSDKATDTHNMAARYPGVAELWDLEKNKGILPTEVTPKVNKDMWLTCKQGHSFSGRGNNVTNLMDKKGRYYPVCPECEGRKPRLFTNTQTELKTLVAALGNDPEAFEALSPAIQYSLMSKMGLLRGGQDSMSRTIGMSIVHGDLTLKDVMAANDYTKIDDHVRDNYNDDDDTNLTAVADIDLDTNNTTPHRIATVDHVLHSVAVLDTIDADAELAESIAREANESLWERAYANPDDLDNYAAMLNSQRGHSEAADATIDRFTRELDIVRNTPLPQGYTTHRYDADGNPVTIDPSLPQRRFAALVDDRRRVMNWSGTGAGKTLSASLAVQTTGARETLVVCPNAVTDQWAHEFRQGFPENTEIRMGLPEPGGTLPDPAPGINRVWVANYDKFQGDPAALDSRIGPLAERVDAIVFDEIHMAKSRDEKATSARRKALLKFTDAAGEANPDLVVIGASATPVVNELEEAKSVLRLVEGPTSASFPTKPTIKNAIAAHQRLAAAGVRNLPTYATTLNRIDETVDVTANVHKIQARVNALREAKSDTPGTLAPMHAAIMERALLPEKMPKIVSAAKANKTNGNGPTLVYTHYISGMVTPMQKSLEAEGLRVATYTGNETEADRTEALRRFRNGEVDVLIGGRTIATGVDGLQHTSHNLVVASMSDTAAHDDQLMGRLYRRGQTKNVNATYILTEAKAGNVRWSWCKDVRQRRVHFKRDIANAAVDGVLPDGVLDDANKGAAKAIDGLKAFADSLSKQNS